VIAEVARAAVIAGEIHTPDVMIPDAVKWRIIAAAILTTIILAGWKTPKIRGVMIVVGTVVATVLVISVWGTHPLAG